MYITSWLVNTLVAPRVGAWIEMEDYMGDLIQCKSLPVWERGLKLLIIYGLLSLHRRSPCGSVD